MIAFIHINKTAGTTLKYILRRSFGGGHCDVRIHPKNEGEEGDINKRVLTLLDLKRTKKINPWLKSISGHLVTGYSDIKEMEGIRFYTFLRDPIARTLSHYQYSKRHHPDIEPLEDWLRKPYNRNVQSRKLVGSENGQRAVEFITNNVGFVGLQENFVESLLLMKRWVNNSKFDPRHVAMNVAGKSTNNAEDDIDSEIFEALRKANEEDIKVFQFVRDQVYPKQIENYGESFETDLEDFQRQNQSFTKKKSKKGKILRGIYWALLPAISKGRVFIKD